MRSGHCAILLAAFGVLLPCAEGQEEDLTPKTLETMRQHVASLRALSRPSKGNERPLKLVDTPVLRYSDAGGITTDASIWVWGEQGRPAIVAGVFFHTQEDREPKWSCELLSLADGGVTVSSGAGWSWEPDKSALEWLAIEDVPGDTERQRLRQMKEIAERFELATIGRAARSQLRLMVQPLYRYADKERGLIDGAIFAYAAGTNPEALLLVECRNAGDGPAWHLAFARFGADGCQARKGERVVWESAAIGRWDAKEPYFSQFGPVERVFETVGAK